MIFFPSHEYQSRQPGLARSASDGAQEEGPRPDHACTDPAITSGIDPSVESQHCCGPTLGCGQPVHGSGDERRQLVAPDGEIGLRVHRYLALVFLAFGVLFRLAAERAFFAGWVDVGRRASASSGPGPPRFVPRGPYRPSPGATVSRFRRSRQRSPEPWRGDRDAPRTLPSGPHARLGRRWTALRAPGTTGVPSQGRNGRSGRLPGGRHSAWWGRRRSAASASQGLRSSSLAEAPGSASAPSRAISSCCLARKAARATSSLFEKWKENALAHPTGEDEIVEGDAVKAILGKSPGCGVDTSERVRSARC